MKLIKSVKTENFHEIELEKRFLFWTYRVKYRMVGIKTGNTAIFRFKDPNGYYKTGLGEWLGMIDYFKITP